MRAALSPCLRLPPHAIFIVSVCLCMELRWSLSLPNPSRSRVASCSQRYVSCRMSRSASTFTFRSLPAGSTPTPQDRGRRGA
eukprot:451372-Hanusia_phi.AAC.1